MSTINAKKLYLAFFLLTVSIAAYAKSIVNIQTWNTTRGTKVLFVEAHELPIFDINIAFYAGSAADGNNYGLANFTSSMIDAGTKNLTVDQIADNFDRLGAAFYSTTSRDINEMGLRCLTDPKILNNALKIFKIVLCEPNFPANEINRIKKQILIALEQKKQNPDRIAYDEFYQNLYQNFPYGHPVIGIDKTIVTINRKNLLDFYRKYYTARNALITMVGDITRKQAEEIAEKLTDKLPLGEKRSLEVLPTPKKTNAAIKHHEFPSTQTNVYMGQLGISRTDPDYFPLLVGNYILGLSPISDLYLEVREKLGLVYGIRSFFVPTLYQGPFIITFSTSNEKAELALQTATTKLNNFLEKGPTEEQLITAKKSLTGKFPMRLANNRSMLNSIQEVGFYNLPLNYLDTYIDKINAVTLKDTKDAFKRHIDFGNMLIIKVGKSSHSKS